MGHVLLSPQAVLDLVRERTSPWVALGISLMAVVLGVCSGHERGSEEAPGPCAGLLGCLGDHPAPLG